MPVSGSCPPLGLSVISNLLGVLLSLFIHLCSSLPLLPFHHLLDHNQTSQCLLLCTEQSFKKFSFVLTEAHFTVTKLRVEAIIQLVCSVLELIYEFGQLNSEGQPQGNSVPRGMILPPQFTF